MTNKQKLLYFTEFRKVAKLRPELNTRELSELRHTLHVEALGCDRSSKAFNNEDLDKVLGVFRAITDPTGVNKQLRQIRQGKIRLLYKVKKEQLAQLELYNADAEEYLLTVARAKFSKRSDFHWLSDLDVLTEWELQQLVMTLAARINGMRNDAGHSVKEMEALARGETVETVGEACGGHDTQLKQGVNEREAECPF